MERDKMRIVIALVLALGLAMQAKADSAPFDYYVLALSWSPNWCAREGDARNADQCDSRHDHGWILHGLWPQFESGWPSYCQTRSAPPSRRDMDEMKDIMGSSGLARHQWKKHGTCAGTTSGEYFDLSRKAYEQIERPPVFRRLTKPVRLPASVVEDAFLKANPGLTEKSVTVTCRDGYIQEVRVCLTPDLAPRDCGADVARACTLENALFDPVR